jgi:hypothetical protein
MIDTEVHLGHHAEQYRPLILRRLLRDARQAIAQTLPKGLSIYSALGSHPSGAMQAITSDQTMLADQDPMLKSPARPEWNATCR